MIEIDGERISGRTRAELRPFSKHVQMVFQDPYASLNPRQRVGDIIALGPTLNGVSREQAIAEARELLRLVGLKPDAVDRTLMNSRAASGSGSESLARLPSSLS